MKKGERKPVEAHYNKELIGKFPAAGYKDDSSDDLRCYSLQARLEQHFDGNELVGMSRKNLQSICSGKVADGKFLGISLSYTSAEQFTDQELRTGFLEDVSAFKKWKEDNILYKITHKKDLKGKVDCNGIIYRTKSKLSRDGLYCCPCNKDQRCHNGKKIRASAFTVAPIPFGEFTL